MHVIIDIFDILNFRNHITSDVKFYKFSLRSKSQQKIIHFSLTSPKINGFSSIPDITTYWLALYFFISCSNSILFIACFIIDWVLSSCFLNESAMYSPKLSHSSFFLVKSDRRRSLMVSDNLLSRWWLLYSLTTRLLIGLMRRGLWVWCFLTLALLTYVSMTGSSLMRTSSWTEWESSSLSSSSDDVGSVCLLCVRRFPLIGCWTEMEL